MNIQDKLEGLTEEEKKYVLSILKDMDSGNSESFTELMYDDYDIVSIFKGIFI